ncbi:hypothetical protein STANM309S_03680 [Streptomyces tanashiensis]
MVQEDGPAVTARGEAAGADGPHRVRHPVAGQAVLAVEEVVDGEEGERREPVQDGLDLPGGQRAGGADLADGLPAEGPLEDGQPLPQELFVRAAARVPPLGRGDLVQAHRLAPQKFGLRWFSAHMRSSPRVTSPPFSCDLGRISWNSAGNTA